RLLSPSGPTPSALLPQDLRAAMSNRSGGRRSPTFWPKMAKNRPIALHQTQELVGNSQWERWPPGYGRETPPPQGGAIGWHARGPRAGEEDVGAMQTIPWRSTVGNPGLTRYTRGCLLPGQRRARMLKDVEKDGFRTVTKRHETVKTGNPG